jgi:hypothetical protein
VVRDKAEILDGAGEDEFVDEKNDGFCGKVGRNPFNLVELVEPDFQVFKELLFEFRFLRRVLQTTHDIQHAASFAAARQKIGEGQFLEGLGFKEKVARAEEPCGAKVGENQVFMVAEIFLSRRYFLT